MLVAPGAPDDSVLLRRVTTADEDARMPPDEPLSEAEVALLSRWIAEGAAWPEPEDDGGEATHWAWLPPTAVAPPTVRDAAWVANPIDAFVLARLEAEGLGPSPPEEPARLLRRASLDLTGLPPTLEQLDAYLAEAGDPEAWERAVDRLLASPHYAEARARTWLDLARYADTNGYEIDKTRDMSRWRDWVIDAYDRDLPFDRFTVEQLAGDLLPDANLETRIATGFHRNTMLNFEGGTDPEEYRAAAVVDRVNTTAAVWLGATLACAQCHDHKYDPFSQEEFFGLYAFFDQTADTGNALAPTVEAPSPEQARRRAEIAAEREAAQERLDGPWPEADDAQVAWESQVRGFLPPPVAWTALPALAAEALGETELRVLEDGTTLAPGPVADTDRYVIEFAAPDERLAALRVRARFDPEDESRGVGHGGGNFVLSGFELRRASDSPGAPGVRWRGATSDFRQAGGFRPRRASDGLEPGGWAVAKRPEYLEPSIVFLPEGPFETRPGERLVAELAFESRFPRHLMRRVALSSTSADTLAHRLAPVERSPWRVTGPHAGDDYADAFERAVEFAEDPRIAWTERPDWSDGRVHAFEPAENATWILERTLRADAPRVLTAHLGSDDGARLWLGDTLLFQTRDRRAAAPDQNDVRVALPAGEHVLRLAVTNGDGLSGFFFELDPASDRDLASPFDLALAAPPGTRTPLQVELVRDHFRREVFPAGVELARALRDLEIEEQELSAAIRSVLVLRAVDQPRTTRLHARGSHLTPGAVIEPHTPAALPPFVEGDEGDERPRDRLGLARWLVDPEHAIAARVAVNRAWSEVFGEGLVPTLDDFGSRGDPRSHPHLLDWLARRFVDDGWSTRALFRLLVTSSTYRQSTRPSPELRERDPRNVLLARGPRRRAPAETVRDVALTASGLLDRAVGGPSVFPPQPEGIWRSTYSDESWVESPGGARHRRGLYVFWKRTAGYPSFAAFDAPSREVSCTRRARTNTPLQALVALNDPAFVEAARALGERALREGGADDGARLSHAFRLCTARRPSPSELAALQRLLDEARSRFADDSAAAVRLLDAGGAGGFGGGGRNVEAAAWTVVGNVLLNLDETLTIG